MFVVNEDKSIYCTRGDVGAFAVSAADDNGNAYSFAVGETVRFKVFAKKDCNDVKLTKDFLVTEESESVNIVLDESDTKIGDVISKPMDYWYEVELNPETAPQTIIGYDDDGAKIFRLYPEGAESE